MEIKNSLDWQRVEIELLKLGNLLPMFTSDIRLLCKNLSVQVKELGNLEIIERRTRSRLSKVHCEEKVNQINIEIKKINQMHLMSLLSR